MALLPVVPASYAVLSLDGPCLVGVAILILILPFVPIAAPDWFRSLAMYGNGVALLQLASFLMSTCALLLVAARGAFSYARPILQARLNENRTCADRVGRSPGVRRGIG